jgi:hypothetical protein
MEEIDSTRAAPTQHMSLSDAGIPYTSLLARPLSLPTEAAMEGAPSERGRR